MNKTGTTTLSSCLKMLGLRHKSGNTDLIKMIKCDSNYERFDKVVEKYDAFKDLPFNLMYEYLDKKFPNSKFIHTIRESETAWLNSFKRHCSQGKGSSLNRKLMFGYEDVNGNEEAFLRIYREHNANIEKYFKNKQDQILKVCWETENSWEKLCNFLNKPIPELPLPHLNTTSK